jgi:acyl carrier protein
MPENRGEKLPVSLINQLKEKLDINIDRSDIVDTIFSISSLFTTLSKVVLIISNSFSIHRL